MSIDFIRPEVEELRPRISVIGVGGAGGNAIANMIQADVQGVDFIVANTDAQALNHSLADRKIQLGLRITLDGHESAGTVVLHADRAHVFTDAGSHAL